MSRAGLTLIELVVGITVASAVLTAGYAGVTTALDRREQAVAVLDEDLAAASVRASLRSWLRGAQTVPEVSGPLFSGVDAEHENLADDQLAFLTSAETPLGTGRATVRLFIERDPDTAVQGLVAEFVTWLGTERTRIELIPEARELDVRYRSRLLSGRDWLPSWISSTVMPEGVEVRVRGAPEAPALHPLLAYPVRVALKGGR